jgi:hypothetical protein
MRVEPHDSAADAVELMLDAIVPNHLIAMEHVLKQLAQFGNVLLPITEIVNEAAEGVFASDTELFQKGIVYDPDTKFGI